MYITTRELGGCFALGTIIVNAAYADDVTHGAKQTETTLSEVTVTADQIVDVGYVVTRSRAATKTDTPIMESPQSISIITNTQFLDQGAQTLQDALRYSAGVRTDAYGLDSRGDWAFLRGTEFVQYQDGLRMFFDFFSNIRPDPYALDSVEIMRGPASVLYGQGNAGGIINVRSKRPQEDVQREVNLQYGNYDRKQIGVDFTGPITKDRKWLYRFVGLGRDSETQVNFSESDRWLVAPSITWRPTNRTTFTLLTNFQRDIGTVTTAFPPWSGTLLPNPNGKLPTSLFTSEPEFDRFENDQNAVGWQFEHAFNETWTVRQNFRYSNSAVDYRTFYPDVFSNPSNPFVDAAQRQVFRFGYIRQQEDSVWTLDNHLQAQWRSGVLRHTTLFGFDYSHAHIQKQQGFNYLATPFDLFNPVYGNFVAPVAIPEADTTIYQAGIYAQDQIKLGSHWVLTGGFRHDWTATEVDDGSDALEEAALTGRIGLIYLADNGFAPYVSYAQSFNPLASTDFFNRPYKPIRGEQVEVGLRYQPKDSSSLVTVSLYDLKEENRRSPDPNNPFNELQLGRAEIRGAELEIVANLARDLDLIGAYSYTHARTGDGTGAQNSFIAEVVPHMGSLWAKYRFKLGDLGGFSVGAGIRYLSNHPDESGTLDVPSVALFDALLAYEAGPWKVALNGTNLTDESYIATCLSRGDCWYGSRATLVGSVTYQF